MDRAMNEQTGESFSYISSGLVNAKIKLTFLGAGHEATASSLTCNLDVGLKSKLIKFAFPFLLSFFFRLQKTPPITQSSNVFDAPKILSVSADNHLERFPMARLCCIGLLFNFFNSS